MTKKPIHIIAPYPRGKAPSQRFRFEQYISFWEEAGYDVHYHSFHTTNSWNRLYQRGKFLQKIADLAYLYLRRWFLLFRLISAKNIFMHREMAHLGPPIFEWILVKIFRKKYTYDFDDAIWIPNYSQANARFQKLKYYQKIPHLIRWADQVNAGNEFLAAYARQFSSHVQVIPTTIDLENLHNTRINPDAMPLTIGWTGTHSTMHYLEPLIPVLQKLEQEFTFHFRIISNQKPQFELNSLEYIEWKEESEMEDLAGIQIGVMPLVLDAWSEGKCGFKALQYMSLGMSSVVSPIGVNTQIIQHLQNGLIANNDEEWETSLRSLLTDKSLRKKMGDQAHKSIQDYWSVEAWKEKYIHLFDNKPNL